jgi:DNA replication protein DnaC
MHTSLSKINNISISGDNNIVFQDVNGNVKIEVNADDEGARKLIAELQRNSANFQQEFDEIRDYLKQRKEPVLQQFADKIYNINYIENANFNGKYEVCILKANIVNIQERVLSDSNKTHLELLESLKERYKQRLEETKNTIADFTLDLTATYTWENNTPKTEKYKVPNIKEGDSAGDFYRLFDDFINKSKKLVVLGEAGSGKTVLLWRFAVNLLDIAINELCIKKIPNPRFPIPILLSLATWRDEDKLSFEEWVEKNLVHSVGRYGISPKYAKELMQKKKNKQLDFVFLFDGLDEIPFEKDRQSIINKIDDYYRNYQNSKLPLYLISCRKEEWTLTKDSLTAATIVIQNLKEEYVYEQLKKLSTDGTYNDASNRLLETLEKDKNLSKLLNTAFLVNIALSIEFEFGKKHKYKSFDFSKIKNRDDLVSTYLNQEIKKLEPEYPKARHYLSFLATKMKENKKGIAFELVDMQPNWLLFKRLPQVNYKTFYNLSRLIGLAIFILFVGNITNFLVPSIMLMSISPFILLKERDIELVKTKKFFNLLQFVNIQFNVLLRYGLHISISVLLIFMMSNNYYTKLPEIFYINQIISFGAFVYIFITSYFYLSTVFLGFYLAYQPIRILKTTSNYQSLFSYFWYDFIKFQLIIFILFLGHLYLMEKNIYNFEKHLLLIMSGFYLTFYVSPIFSHFILRFVLFKHNFLPFQVVSFLNQVSGTPDIKDEKGNLIKKGIEGTGIMEKDGGQWRFRHQLIMDALVSKRSE